MSTRIGNIIRSLRIKEPLKAYDIQKKFDEVGDAIQRLPIFIGNGSPEGVESAPVGSLFLRLDGGTNTTLYVKEQTSNDQTIGWVAK